MEEKARKKMPSRNAGTSITKKKERNVSGGVEKSEATNT